MKSLSLPIILDTFFIFFISLFFFYALFLYGVGGYSLSIFLSSVISVLISSIFVIYSSMKGEFKRAKELEKQNIKNFNYNLYFITKPNLLEILKGYYERQNKKVIVSENYLTIENESIIFPIIKPEEITISDIIWCVNNSGNNLKRIILGVNFNSCCEDFINEVGLDIELLKSENLYLTLKEENIFINQIEINPKPKKRLSKYFNKIFTKQQYKRFILAGIVITASSFFSFYPVYYLIFGGTLIFLGVYLKIFKKE